MKNRVARFLSSRYAAILAVVAAPVSVFADTTPLTLPDTGVDPSAYSSALVTLLGVSAGAAIGAGLAILAIWLGYHYLIKGVRKGG